MIFFNTSRKSILFLKIFYIVVGPFRPLDLTSLCRVELVVPKISVYPIR